MSRDPLPSALLICLAACVGCGGSADEAATAPDSPDRSGAVRTDPAGVAPAAADRDVERPPVSQADSERQAANEAPPVAAPTDPIDSVPEGRTYRRAIAALDEGDFERAEQLRETLEDHPTFAVLARGIDAVRLVKRRRYQKAIEVAEEISRFPVMRAEAYVIAGEAFRGQGRWADAISAFRSALELRPDHVRAHRWLGAVYYDTGAMQLAARHLRRVADLDPNEYRSLRLAGVIHIDYQQYDEAVKDYRQLLSREMPKAVEIEARLKLADALRELRKLDDALQTLESCPEIPEVWATRAACFESAGDVAKALELARRALDAAPKHRRAHLVAGRVRMAKRQWDAAVAHFRTAVEADPTAHKSRFLLGRALVQAGQVSEGQAEIERSVELKEATLELAELHLEAIQRPGDAELRMRMGRLAESIGRPQTALSWYRAASGLDPDSEKAAEAVRRLQSAASGESAPGPAVSRGE